jgi:hypothetical protein
MVKEVVQKRVARVVPELEKKKRDPNGKAE